MACFLQGSFKLIVSNPTTVGIIQGTTWVLGWLGKLGITGGLTFSFYYCLEMGHFPHQDHKWCTDMALPLFPNDTSDFTIDSIDLCTNTDAEQPLEIANILMISPVQAEAQYKDSARCVNDLGNTIGAKNQDLCTTLVVKYYELPCFCVAVLTFLVANAFMQAYECTTDTLLISFLLDEKYLLLLS